MNRVAFSFVSLALLSATLIVDASSVMHDNVAEATSLWKVSSPANHLELGGNDHVLDFSTDDGTLGSTYSLTATFYSDSGCSTQVDTQTYTGDALTKNNQNFYILSSFLYIYANCELGQYVIFNDANNPSNKTTCAEYTARSERPRYCAITSGNPLALPLPLTSAT